MKFKRKHILPILGVVLILIQIIRIDKTNPPVDSSLDFVATMNPPEGVKKNLIAACYDCHSNETKYPWYTNIAPVSWWIKGHINGGKQHLNYSVWGEYTKGKQEHKVEESIEVLENQRMPLSSYTWLHPDAKLSDSDRNEMIEYFKKMQ